MSRSFWLAPTPLGTALRLSVAFLSLLLLIELVLIAMDGGPGGREVSASPADFTLHSPVDLAPQNTYEELVRRTLFSPDRKPKESVQSSTAVTSGKASEHWLLAGVVKSGAESYAMFNEKVGQRHLKLQAEMLLDGWKIESIEADKVALSKNGEVDTLLLLISEPPKKSKRARRKQSRSAVRIGSGDEAKKRRATQQKTQAPRLVKPAAQTQAEGL